MQAARFAVTDARRSRADGRRAEGRHVPGVASGSGRSRGVSPNDSGRIKLTGTANGTLLLRRETSRILRIQT